MAQTTNNQQVADFVAIIPAGGAGTRLWPLSRRSDPKFLHDLTASGQTLLQGTWQRLAALASRQVVVTGGAHAAAVTRQLPDLAVEDLLVEPSPKDSMAAIGLAAAVIQARQPGAIIGSFAADHVIRDVSAFDAAVRQAIVVARTGKLVTLGILPTHPSTGFGYILGGSSLTQDLAPDAVAVAHFVEKPDAVTAQAYLADGRYRWNAGMFVAQATTILALLDQHCPELAADLRRLGQAWDTPEREELLAQIWPGLTKIAIDYAIVEPAAAAGQVAMVAGDFGWDDVGDFAALGSVLPPGIDGVQRLGGGEVLAHDSTGVVVAGSGRLVSVLGLRDVVVVDTPDALLVTTKERAQQVKGLVDQLTDQGHDHLR